MVEELRARLLGEEPGADNSARVMSEVADAVFDVVTEDPQHPHVSDDVKPSAVEKHGRDERHVRVRKTDGRGPRGVGEPRGHEPEEIGHLLRGLGGKRELPEEEEEIDRDDGPRGEGHVPSRDLVADRNHAIAAKGVRRRFTDAIFPPPARGVGSEEAR